MTLQEASEFLHVHPNTLRRWDEQGILKAVRFGQRKDRHYQADLLDEFVKSSSDQHAKHLQHETAAVAPNEQVARRLKQLEVITTSLYQLDTLDKMSKHMCRHLAQALKAVSCIVLIPGQLPDTLHILGHHGYPQYMLKRWKNIPMTWKVPSADVARTNMPIILMSREEIGIMYPLLIEKSYILQAVGSYVALPLIISGKNAGAICIGFSSPKQFHNDDVHFLLSIARHCSWAIERARLYQHELDSKKITLKMQEITSRISDAATRFLVPSTPEETYAVIIEEAKKLTSSVHGSIFLWQGNKLNRIYTSFPGLYDIHPRKNGRTYTTFYNRQPSIYYVKRHKEPHPQLIRLGIRSVLYVPLYYDTKTIGVMNVLSEQIDNWSKDGLDFLNLFGRLASLAIHKTQLYYEAKNSLENQRLFLSIASHEIKSPLSSVHGYIQILERRLKKADSEDVSILGRLSEETVRLNHLVTEFLGKEGMQLSPQGYRWRGCSVRKLLKSAKDDFSFLYPSHKLNIVDLLKSEDMIRGDFDKLMQVFVNVLGNAGKYSEAGSKITVRFSEKDGVIQIVVRDNGRGIPTRDLSHIFRKFYRADNSEKGMGLGLYLVKTIVENHNGIIKITSKVHRGTTVTMQFPLYVDTRKSH